MNKATTKELQSSYVCALFKDYQLIKVNEAIARGEKFVQIDFERFPTCYTVDPMQKDLSDFIDNRLSAKLGKFYARTGPRTCIVSYVI